MTLEVFPRARAVLPGKSVLVCKRYCVDDKVYERELRTKAEKVGLGDFVRWVETVPYDNMPELYALAHPVVNSPSVDGFPVSFIEAGACGKRVVTNRLPPYGGVGLEDFSLTVPDYSMELLRRAIAEALMERPESVSAKVQLARQCAMKYGAEKKGVEQLLTVCSKLAKRYNRENSRKGVASWCRRL